MNTTILQKCLTELGTEHPRLDYLRGCLETMMEMSSLLKPLAMAGLSVPVGQLLPPTTSTFSTANAGIPVRNNLDEIKRMAGEA